MNGPKQIQCLGLSGEYFIRAKKKQNYQIIALGVQFERNRTY